MVLTLLTLGLAIRLYLALTSFCIAADGVAYVKMARLFAAGDWAGALARVFSPLYPMLIAVAHHLIPNWELAGSLVSAVLGAAAVPMVYFLMREIEDGRDLAAGAAALTAIHPELASYSASVLTEGGYFFFVVAVVYFAVRGIRLQSVRWIAVGGIVNGIAYLYRTEAVGLPVAVAAFLVAGPFIWGEWRSGFSARASAVYLVLFAAVASPYLIYLRLNTGHWIVGREVAAALSFKISEVSQDGARWQALGFSPYVPLGAMLRQVPTLYLKKTAMDFARSFYYFVQALEPPVAIALLLGLRKRGRAVLTEWRQALPAAIVIFYFCGLALLNTGRRFLAHYMILTFGWAALGVAVAAAWLSSVELPGGRRIPAGAMVLGLALVTLPRTLWPLGYDMRGFREAGVLISRASGNARAVVSGDSRVAFYAGAEYLPLPPSAKLDLCQWLGTHPQAGYVMLTSRDEGNAEDPSRARCLALVKRYHRYGRGYYDLFKVVNSGQ
jgi:hypothetical protein